MKKIVSLLLIAAMTMSLGITAFAATGMDAFKADKKYTGFTDVGAGFWYYNSVKAAFEYGLVKGDTPTTFNPNGTLTVAAAIVMADRVHMLYHTGKDTLTNGTPWYQTYVDYAIANGIIKEGDFDNYNRDITRAEMADIFTRALPEKEYEVINYIDESCPADVIGHKYQDQIQTLFRAGIVTGNDPFGTYTPNANIKRSEAAAIISRIVDPSLRRRIELLEEWEYDELVTVAAVYNSIPETASMEGSDEGFELTSDTSAVAVYKTLNITEGIPMTILDIPREELGAELAAGIDATDVTATTLAFGSIPAYRYDFTAPLDTDIDMRGSYYVFLEGTDMYMIVCFVVHYGDAAQIALANQVLVDSVNNVKVGGNLPSIKMTK